MSERYIRGDLDSSLEVPASAQYQSEVNAPDALQNRYSLFRYNRRVLALSLGIIGIIILTGVSAALVTKHSSNNPVGSVDPSSKYSVSNLTLSGVNPLTIGQADHLEINGQLRVNAGLVLAPSTAPKDAVIGQVYFDQATNKPYYYDGKSFICLIQDVPQSVASIGGAKGVVGLGSGLQLSNGQLRLTDAILQASASPGATAGLVSSVQGQTGAVSFSGGNGIAVNGTAISNTGVVSVGGLGGNLGLGRGLAVQGGAIKTTVSLTSGSANLVVSDDGNGNYSITDTSPGAGGAGGVTLGPVSAQSDTSGNTSINIDKTSAGNLLRLASSGVDKFVVDQTGTITSGSIAYSKVTGAPATTVTSLGGASGAISLGSGLTIAGATLSNSGVVSLAGTVNQINASSSTGVVTLSLPQAIATTSNPSFNNLSLGGTLSATGAVNLANTFGVAGLTTLSGGVSVSGSVNINTTGTGSTTVGNAGSTFAVLSSGLNVTTWGALSGITTLNATGAIVAASSGNTLNGLIVNAGSLSGVTGYVQTSGSFSQSGSGSFSTGTGTTTIGSLSTGLVLSNASGVLSAGAVDRNSASYFNTALTVANGGTGAGTAGGARGNLGAAASGANSDITSLSAVTSVGGTGAALALQGNASSVFSGTAGSFTTSLGFAAPTSNVLYLLPAAAAGTYNLCTTVGNCAGTGGGVTTAGGTSGKLAKFTGAQTLGDSLISESGSTVTIGGSLAVNAIAPTAALLLGVTGQNVTVQGAAVAITSTSGANTNRLSFVTPAGSSHTIIVPNASGTVAVSASGPLAIDSSGNLTCASCTTSGGGAGGAVDSLNAINGSVSLQGTANQIVITNNSGTKTITVSTPQDINTSSSPTFSSETLTNTLSVMNAISAGSLSTSGTLAVSGAATAASFNALNLTANANGFTVAGGTAVKTVIVTSNVTLDQNLATAASPTFNSLTLSTALGVGNGGTGSTSAAGARTNLGVAATGANSDITSISGLTTALSAGQGGTGINGSNAANGKLLIGNGAGYTLANLTQGSGISITNGAGSISIAIDGTVCTTSGNCAGAGTGVTTAGGTTNKIALFTGSQAISDSLLSQSGATITATGNLTATLAIQGNTLSIGTGTFTVNASGAITAATGITSSGAITFSSLNSVGVLHTNGSGVVSTGTVALGTETTGNYVATLGTLTGLTVTGNTGAGSTPALSVSYGSASSTAAQGNTVLSFTGSGNLTGSVSGSAGGGFSTNTLDVLASPTFSGLITANGGLTVATNSNLTQTGTGAFSTGTGAVSLNGNVTIASGTSISLVGGITSSRPASPTEGMLYYDTTTKSLLVYSNNKWQADRDSNTKIVATSASGGTSGALASPNPDGADFVNASTTSAQTVINSALTAAAGGKVYLSEGTYIIDGSISVPNNTSLVGAGPGTIIKYKNGLNVDFYGIVNTDTTTGTHIAIQDLLIDGNRNNQSTGLMGGVGLIGMGGGSGSTARDGAKINNIIVRNMFFGAGSPRGGIQIESSSNNIVSGSTVINSAGEGVMLFGAANNVITGNIFQGTDFGVYVYSATYTSITGNVMQGNARGIKFYAANNNSATGNTIITTAATAIDLFSATNTIVSGNKIHDSGGPTLNSGISLSFSSTNNTISGNNITDSSCTSSCTAISIDSTSNKNYLSDNLHVGTAANPSTISDSNSSTIYANQLDASGNLINRNPGGGLAVGKTSASTSLDLQGAFKTTALPTPAPVSLALVGTTSATTYGYRVSALDGLGETLASTESTVSTGNITLNGSSYVTITWAPIGGAIQYKVYRTTSTGTPASIGLIATVPGNVSTINDTGLAASGSVATSDTTGNASIAGSIQGAGSLNIGGTSTLVGTVSLGTASTVAGQLKLYSAGNTGSITLQGANTAGNYTLSVPNTIAANDTLCLVTLNNCTGSGAGAVGALDSQTANANGATISSNTLYLQSASNTAPGLVNTVAQTLAGAKTFTNNVTLNAGVTVAAGQTISLVGGITSTRPASPSAGQLYFDTTTNTMLQYNGSKWVSDRATTTKIVAASNSSQAVKDSADYVATGTGDQATINTALAAAAGGSVYLAEGTYTVSAAIFVPNNTTLFGAGAGTLITIPNGQNGNYSIITNADTTTGTHVVIHDLQIDGNKANQTSGSMDGIYFNHMGGGSGSSARDGGSIRDVLIRSMYGSNEAINLTLSNNNTLIGNTLTANTIGITLSSSANNTVTSNIAEGSTSYGIFLSNSSNNAVTGNTTQGNASGGIIVSNSNNNTVSSNTVQVNAVYGIILSSASANIVSGNKVHDNGGATTNNGITVASSTSNTISSNDITDASCTANCYAIYLADSGSTSNLLSANNLTSPESINDAATNTIYDAQTNGSGDLILKTTSGKVGVNTLTPVEALNVYNGNLQVDYGNIKLNQVAAPAAPAVAVNATAGNLTGPLYYVITLVTATGETNYGTLSASVNPTSQQVDLSAIPTGTSGVVTSRKIYRGNSSNGPFNLVATIADNVTTTYTDNIANGSLGVAAKDLNFTGGLYVVNGNNLLNISTQAAVSNSFVGLQAGAANTSGIYNSAFGASALQNNTVGAFNTANGYNALLSNTSGGGNTATGSHALRFNTTGGSNTATGYASLSSNTTGNFNTANGYNALQSNTTGVNNTASGFSSLDSNTTGQYNVGIGTYASKANLTGSYNSVTGYGALQNNTTGSFNTASGTLAAYGSGCGAGVGCAISGLAVSGYQAGYSLQTGADYTTLMGYQSGQNITTGTWNVGVGAYSLQSTTNGGANTAVGYQSLKLNTSGSNNTASGYTSLAANTTGNFNTASGSGALYSNTTGSSNTGVGYNALLNNTTATYNTALGAQALQASTTGDQNTGLGASALATNTTGFNNTAVGSFSLRYNTTGGQNVATGTYSLLNNTTGGGNAATGANSLFNNTTGSSNAGHGSASLYNTTTGSYNTSNGALSVFANTVGSNNTGNGYATLRYLGTYTGTISATANNGGKAQFTSTSALSLTAGATITISGTTSYNGTQTVQSVDTNTSFTITQAYSTADAAGSWTTASSDSNTAVGYQSGFGAAVGYTAVGNSLLGYNTGQNLQTGADYNTVMGYAAGSAITTGNSNVLLGKNAGLNVTTGSNNIVIGSAVNAASATGSNQLQIGSAISGDISIGTLAVKAVTNNAATFEVKNSAGGQVLAVDTTANQLNVAGNVNFNQVAAPVTTLTAALGGAGALTGSYYYVVSYVTANGETEYGPRTIFAINPSGQQVSLTTIPVSPSNLVTARKIYRGPFGGPYNLVTTINDNTTTTFNDNVSSLGAFAKTDNTTAVLAVVGSAAFSVGATSQNTWVGLQTGLATNYGTANAVLGYQALQQNTSGSRNSVIGAMALQQNNTGYDNVANGTQALQSNTGGYDNVAVGSLSLKLNTTGWANTGVGYDSLAANTTGYLNTGVGTYALAANTTGMSNVALGYSSLSRNTTGYNNTASGYNSLYYNTTGTYNAAFGDYALYDNTGGNYNTATGDNALHDNGIGSNNTADGHYALGNNDSGNFNVGVGDGAVYRNISGSNNTGAGYSALFYLQTVSGTISATASNGGNAQFTSSSTTRLTAGTVVTISGTTSYNGSWTVSSVDSPTSFTIAKAFSTTDATGAWVTTSTDSNTAVGYNAGRGSSFTNGYTAVGNSVLGANAGMWLQTGSDYNTLVGYNSGNVLSTGKQNVLLGYNAGANLTSGSNNIIIGQNINAASATGSNQLNIGGLLQGDLSSGTAKFKGALTLGTASTVSGSLTIANAASAFTTTLQTATAAQNTTLTIPASGAADTFCLQTLANCSGSGVSAVGALDGQAKNANGATISGASIYLQTADASNPGLVTAGTQTLAGAKTLSGALQVNNTVAVSTTSATAFQVQDAGGTNTIFKVDTSTGALTVKSTGNSIVALQVLDSTGAVAFVVDASNKRVGINTGATAPGASLTVNGSNNVNPSWPDGLVGTPVNAQISGGYTVPAGKTLYVTSISNQNASAQTIFNGLNYGPVAGNTAVTLGSPIAVAAGASFSSSLGGTMYVTGMLVNTGVTPVNAQISGGYTVPAGKTLYVTSISNQNASAQTIFNGLNYGPVAGNTAVTLGSPIAVAAGASFSSSLGGTMYVTGYLTNSNGFGGP